MNTHSTRTEKLLRLGHKIAVFCPAVALTLALSFLLTIYAPLELYFTNLDEFHFGFAVLFPELFKLFLLMTAGGFLVFAFCYVLYIQLYHTALAAAAVTLVCTYVQGLYMAGSLPPLDGERIVWSQYHVQHIASLVLWFAAGVAVVLLIRFLHMKKMYRVFTGCALLLSATLLVTLAVVCVQYDGLQPKPETVATKRDEFHMSGDQNLVIFVVDAVDSGTFQRLLQSDDPQFAEILEDFTYYPNTVSAYPFTKPSIPFILSGEWYENQEDFGAFSTRALEESPLLQTLRDQNYRMGVYEEELFYENEHIFDFENMKSIQYRLSDSSQLLRAELKLVWFKYAPYPLKRFVSVDMAVFNRLLREEEGAEVFHANNQDFYQDAKDAEIVTVEDKCFRFIHIEGAHVPFRYDKNVNLIDSAQGSYRQNTECAMTVVARYLARLKEAGVYDNSAIILMADHGYDNEHKVPIVGRCNPLLAIKGVEEHHGMYTSDAPISYEDLQEAYQRLLRGTPGDQVFDAREGDDRPRRVLCYDYADDRYMYEYIQYGHASDITTMLPTGVYYDALDHSPEQ